MRVFKRLKKGRYFLFFLLINIMLSVLLEPARGASQIMWRGYYAEEELDTIFVGSSLCQGTFDPSIFNECMGVKSYNMGTPLQAMPQTIRAVEEALEDHEIKTVIFGMGFSTLKQNVVEEAELTFEKARIREKGGIKGVLESISYLYSDNVREEEKSINYFFSWLYNRGELSSADIMENISLKIWQMKEKFFYKNDTIMPTEKGYQNHEGDVLNYDNRWELNTYRYYEADFNEEILGAFEKLLQLCSQRGIDCIVINTPHPYFDVVVCYEFYERNQNEVKALCQKYGADYYDFNLAKPEIFETRPEYYSDYEHMNKEGSQVFCKELCNFLLQREAGVNVEECFYSVSEFLELHADELEAWKSYYW